MQLIRSTVIAASALLLVACPADRQAAEQIDITPDPRIEAAPAYPMPPGEVPIGLEPDTTPRPQVDLDTVRGMGAGTAVAPVGAVQRAAATESRWTPVLPGSHALRLRPQRLRLRSSLRSRLGEYQRQSRGEQGQGSI